MSKGREEAALGHLQNKKCHQPHWAATRILWTNMVAAIITARLLWEAVKDGLRTQMELRETTLDSQATKFELEFGLQQKKMQYLIVH